MKHGTPLPNGSVGKLNVAYKTPLGKMFQGRIEDFLSSPSCNAYLGKVQLLFTSPPFPLNRKKKYGNLQGAGYVEWLSGFAKRFRKLLKPKGSVVIEIGNAWEPGRPAMSTLGLEALLSFLRKGELQLCQQFVCYNPARLPSPAQWVNVDRIRVKDAFTNVWWLSTTDRPKANNRRVLQPYSSEMQNLLAAKSYNAGKRPSEHRIGEKSFLKDNGGAIPPNVLTISNTVANDDYQEYCRRYRRGLHPARMPSGLAEFFIKFLTTRGDLVLDPFAGSNTTGAVAERLGRRWASIEPSRDYILGSRGRFRVAPPRSGAKKR